MKGHRGYNICPWLKNGKHEICGKSCREEYCKVHRRYIRNGSRIPLPCLNCGIGVRSQIQLCRECGRENVRRGARRTKNPRFVYGMMVFARNRPRDEFRPHDAQDWPKRSEERPESRSCSREFSSRPKESMLNTEYCFGLRD